MVMPWWPRIADLLAREGRLAVVMVVETHGSTPREPGAAMVVLPNGSFSGTIGGGTLEWQALGAAQAALGRGERGVALRSLSLGPELGQCCGGRLKLAIDVLDATDLDIIRGFAAMEAVGPVVTIARGTPEHGWERRLARADEALALRGAGAAWLPALGLVQRVADERTPLFLFGAGHVGRALVLALAPLPFRVVWIDPRPGAFPERVPGGVELSQPADPVAELGRAPDEAFLLVMTHSHAVDFDIVAAALTAGRFHHVGLIGSATKRARFLHRLRDLGLGTAAEHSLVCPIGLTAIRSKLPAAIAAGIAADLLVRRDAMAALAATPEERHAHG
jgi:xanthine dehydrogenase accessory factor